MAACSNTLIAYDSSSSTSNVAHYHATAASILEAHPHAAILKWNSDAHLISRRDMKAINAGKKGEGGTNPACVAQHVTRTNFHGHLVLITDGQARPGETDAIFAAAARAQHLAAWDFTRVDVHMVGPRSSVNMSVSCPFTRAAPHAVRHWDPSGSVRDEVTVTAADLEAVALLQTVDTEDAFLAHADAIERAVTARTMGVSTGDPSLRDALLAMKKRVVAAQARALGGRSCVQALTAALDAGDGAAALAAARTLTAEYYGDDEPAEDTADVVSFSARVSRLVAMTEGALQAAFDLQAVNRAIHADRVRRAAATRTAPVASVPLVADAGAGAGAESQAAGGGSDAGTAASARFPCPILLDDVDDVLVLVKADGPSVLEGLDKDVVNAVLDCPLNALGMPEVLARLRAKLDHAVSLKAYKDALRAGSPMDTSPMTRDAVCGGLCLRVDGSTEEHCAATTWALDAALTGGKRVGNPDLWFAVVWQMIERGEAPEWLQEHAAVAAGVRAQMQWRLQHHTSFAALTGLPELPTTRVPLRAAVWYVLAASALNPGPKREPLRAHVRHAQPLVALAALAGVDAALPPGWAAHLARVRALGALLGAVKEGPKRAHELRTLVRGLRQAGVWLEYERVAPAVHARETVVPPLVPVDGAASPEQVAAVAAALGNWVPALRDLRPQDVEYLASLVDPQLSLGDVALPFDAPPATWSPLPPRATWAGSCYTPEAAARYAATPLTVNLATCRPQATFPDGTTWRDRAAAVFGAPLDPSRFISFNKQFGVFVQRFGAYPSSEDLVAYIYNRVCVHGGRATLPTTVLELARQTVDENAEAMAALSPAEFVRRHTASMNLVDRARMEAEAAGVA